MIFSYGFLEGSVTDARQIFLELSIPDDDPLKPAKLMVCDSAPGVRLFATSRPDKEVEICWESDFVWWACVNEEDGLGFEVLQSTDGGREIRAAWKGKEMEPSEKLRDILQKEPLWDIYQLRAVVLVQERVAAQLALLQASHESVQEWRDKVDEVTVRSSVWDAVMRLRRLESEFLAKANTALDDKVHPQPHPSSRFRPSIAYLSKLALSLTHILETGACQLRDGSAVLEAVQPWR